MRSLEGQRQGNLDRATVTSRAIGFSQTLHFAEEVVKIVVPTVMIQVLEFDQDALDIVVRLFLMALAAVSTRIGHYC